jgi:hypothetical protein
MERCWGRGEKWWGVRKKLGLLIVKILNYPTLGMASSPQM